MGKSHTNKDCLLFFHCKLKHVLNFIYTSPHISRVSQMMRQTRVVIVPLQNKERKLHKNVCPQTLNF